MLVWDKYTDERLDTYFSDLVFTCRYSGTYLNGNGARRAGMKRNIGYNGNTESDIKLALLFEHKSFVPTFPHNQLLRYILNIWNHHIEYLKDFLNLGILYFKEEEGLRFLESVCRYIFSATEIEAETIIKTVEALPQRAEEVVMTTAEKLRKEGQREGWEKGQKEGRENTSFEHARKMIEEGLDETLIMRITGLSREKVRKLQEHM
jgi:predicted transposase/invertase (TIGR01784 family)